MGVVMLENGSFEWVVGKAITWSHVLSEAATSRSVKGR